jgi:hypothetical protein
MDLGVPVVSEGGQQAIVMVPNRSHDAEQVM